MDPKQAKEKLGRLQANIEKVIRGKTSVIRMSIIGLLGHGHILLEDVPGVGKTTLAQCIARSIGLSFTRVQFTSDLLPSDILGVTTYDPSKQEFKFRSGPIFTNILLVDEINRTTPKTQSALLEAMNSAQVSLDKTTYDLPNPFIVIATQNPAELHGTFPLPQSQMDRFLMRLHFGYPDAEHERTVLRDMRRTNDLSMIDPVLGAEDLVAMQEGVERVKIDDSLLDYIIRLGATTRDSPQFATGVSTRGTIALCRCAQARAYLEGRDYCTPDDIKLMAVAALAHRITPARAFEDGANRVGVGGELIQSLIEETAVPV